MATKSTTNTRRANIMPHISTGLISRNKLEKEINDNIPKKKEIRTKDNWIESSFEKIPIQGHKGKSEICLKGRDGRNRYVLSKDEEITMKMNVMMGGQ
jgi:hypothetical protein